MLRRMLAMGILSTAIWTTQAWSTVLPQDCSGVNAQQPECVKMMSMASYVEQAKGEAARGEFQAAIKTMDKAIKIAKDFPPDLYVEYVIDQATYAEQWAEDIKGEKGLDQALAILNRAVPYLGRVESVSTKARFYNRNSGLNMALATARNDPFYSEAAIESFRHIIEIIDKAVDPVYWGDIHYNLGLAHATHYEITEDASHLLLGKTALLEAFNQYDKKTMLVKWAMAVSAMADNDAAAAKVYKRDDLLRSAFNGYDAVIKSLDAKSHGDQLSNVYHNSALLYSNRGRETKNLDDLKKAYNYFDRAIDLYEEQRRYFDWVRAYSNQAWSLFYGADITQKDKHFENAIAMAKNILDNFPQHKSPILWADVVYQLGDFQQGYALKKRDVDLLKQAKQSYRIAAKVYQEQGMRDLAGEVKEQLFDIDVLLVAIENAEPEEEAKPEDQGT